MQLRCVIYAVCVSRSFEKYNMFRVVTRHWHCYRSHISLKGMLQSACLICGWIMRLPSVRTHKYNEEKWMHADLFLPLRRHAEIMSASWIRRTNTKIDFPIVYVSSHRAEYIGIISGGCSLLFSVAITGVTDIL